MINPVEQQRSNREHGAEEPSDLTTPKAILDLSEERHNAVIEYTKDLSRFTTSENDPGMILTLKNIHNIPIIRVGITGLELHDQKKLLKIFRKLKSKSLELLGFENDPVKIIDRKSIIKLLDYVTKSGGSVTDLHTARSKAHIISKYSNEAIRRSDGVIDVEKTSIEQIAINPNSGEVKRDSKITSRDGSSVEWIDVVATEESLNRAISTLVNQGRIDGKIGKILIEDEKDKELVVHSRIANTFFRRVSIYKSNSKNERTLDRNILRFVVTESGVYTFHELECEELKECASKLKNNLSEKIASNGSDDQTELITTCHLATTVLHHLITHQERHLHKLNSLIEDNHRMVLKVPASQDLKRASELSDSVAAIELNLGRMQIIPADIRGDFMGIWPTEKRHLEAERLDSRISTIKSQCSELRQSVNQRKDIWSLANEKEKLKANQTSERYLARISALVGSLGVPGLITAITQAEFMQANLTPRQRFLIIMASIPAGLMLLTPAMKDLLTSNILSLPFSRKKSSRSHPLD